VQVNNQPTLSCLSHSGWLKAEQGDLYIFHHIHQCQRLKKRLVSSNLWGTQEF
jgi:hypothetical protein